MRDPKRIKPILELIGAIWSRMPDIRFNQLIYNLQYEFNKKTGKGRVREIYEFDDYTKTLQPTGDYIDLFHVEDGEWRKFLEWKIEQLNS